MNIEEQAIETYKKNMLFLEKKDKLLFEKLQLLERAIELNQFDSSYELEYKDNYFDLLIKSSNEYFYGCNSIEYSTKIVKDINFNSKSNSFKTFYEYNYEKEVIDRAKEASIMSSAVLGTAPITAYVQENLDNKEEMKQIFKYFIFGAGLGLHIPKIHEKINAKVYVIIEPSLEVFRLSLFVTDYTLLSNSNLYFAVSMDEEKFRMLIYTLSEQTFMYDQYIKFFMFNNNCNMYITIIQNQLVSQKHIIYPYNKQLESFKRTYDYMYQGLKYVNLIDNNINKVLNDKPVLLLAMGPSLQENINFIQKNKNKYLIIAIYATMPILEENNIIPDIIIQYDQQELTVMSTIDNVKNIDFFSTSIFLFASHVHPSLIKKLAKNNIYLFNALYESRENTSVLYGPSVGDISYALSLILGVKELYLLGLDLALSENRETHSGDHLGAKAFKDMKEDSTKEFTFRKSIIKIKGNFKNQVDTLPVFKTSINQVNTFTSIYKKKEVNVYNISNGAYFNDTKPMHIKDIDLNEFNILNKDDEKNKLVNIFDEISLSEIREVDLNYNNVKEEDSRYLLKILDQFYKRKYGNITDYKNSIFILFDDLVYGEYKCPDLQQILLSFYKSTLPYVFHLFNTKNLENPKKHIKQINKVFYLQLKKIFEEYLGSLNKKRD